MIISFSGLDGSGKTTQITHLLKNYSNDELKTCSIYDYTSDIRYHHYKELISYYNELKKNDVIHTRFRLNSDENNYFMNLLEFSDFKNQFLAEATALQDYYDARQLDDYMNSCLLNKNKILIYDRYFYDEIAFKTVYGCKYDRMVKMYENFRIPELSFYLRVSPEVIYLRNKNRKDSKTTIYKNIDYIRTLSTYFDHIAEQYHMIILDGELPENELQNTIWKICTDNPILSVFIHLHVIIISYKVYFVTVYFILFAFHKQLLYDSIEVMKMMVTDEVIHSYLNQCKKRKNLSNKTIKAYMIDLYQFKDFMKEKECTKENLNSYFDELYQRYEKPKTVKRKIAVIRALFNYLSYEDLIEHNPFDKIRIQFKEPKILPRTIHMNNMIDIIKLAYEKIEQSDTEYKKNTAIRDAAIIELLFSTGIRVSELCNIKNTDIDLDSRELLIYGKGAKERMLQIGNDSVIMALKAYETIYHTAIEETGYFFLNKNRKRLSEQSVRILLNKFENEIGMDQHITPHMFRHTFATQLLEEDVDIRYIQKILGHSSISTTQIYTHVSSTKQKEILVMKNPRNMIKL